MKLIDNLMQMFVGSRNERQIKSLMKEAQKINNLEPEFEKLSDDELQEKTAEFKHRIEKGESLDDLLHEAFAAVREAAKRTLGQRHYDVQMMGGILLHQGSIAEMVTGEGKTLTSTCPVYLNALAQRGVHLVTVNDYLARRDAEWMGNVFRMLGMNVGFIQNDMGNRERRQMYACDVTYGTNSEFGFDYLRDNMKQDPREQVQRGRFFSVIDEVDSILIDEARTPLIIAGPANDYAEFYARASDVARQLNGIPDVKLKEQLGKMATDRDAYREALEEYDFELKEKESQCLLSDRGIAKVEQILKIGHLYAAENQRWPHMIEQALRAHHLFKKDKQYVVQEGERGLEIVIVDEFTGRLQVGRTWSDGLHQAIEAKEGIRVREESVTHATVTLQNYFKLYDKLAGMTGTAITEAGEFDQIYGLDVVAIPTNRPLIRDDRDDLIYSTEGDKFQAVVCEIVKNHLAGRPCLVGTASVVKSEIFADLLDRVSIRYTSEGLTIRTPVFRLPAPTGGKGRESEAPREVKVEPRVMTIERVREENGRLEIALADPSIRLLDPKANPKVESWFPIPEDIAKEIKAEKGKIGIAHKVLNAKLHQMEAEIVSQAGSRGSVTIATNMAGRGTDIILGGNGEFHTKQWLEREHGVTLKNFLPEEYREEESYVIPREILIKAEQEYETRIKQEYASNFKPRFSKAHDEVIKLGGLAVIGTERHESRRIDNQLRGRCGRQGDPGSSQFFISLDDDLMRMFAGPRMVSMMRSMGLNDGQALQSRMITGAVAKAQRKVEGHHFDQRKNLKEYDDVLDKQRKKIYSLRQSTIEGVDNARGAEIDRKIRFWLNDLLGTRERVAESEAEKIVEYMKKGYNAEWNPERVAGNHRIVVRDNMVLAAKLSHMPASIKKALEDSVYNVTMRLVSEVAHNDNRKEWDLDSLYTNFDHIFGQEIDPEALPAEGLAALESTLEAYGAETYKKRYEAIITAPDGTIEEERIVQLGRYFLLSSIDERWKEHLRNMEHLRYGVHWEAQAQKDPKIVYKREGRVMFDQLLDDIDTEVVRNLHHTKIEEESAPSASAPAPAPRVTSRPSGGKPRGWRPTENLAQQAIEMAKALAEQVNKQEIETAKAAPVQAAANVATDAKVPGPNDACWCDSGKKYKKCHMNSDKAGLSSPS